VSEWRSRTLLAAVASKSLSETPALVVVTPRCAWAKLCAALAWLVRSGAVSRRASVGENVVDLAGAADPAPDPELVGLVRMPWRRDVVGVLGADDTTAGLDARTGCRVTSG